jgi:hypothetical protein
MKASRSSNALKPEREGVLAVLNEQSTIDRVQGVIRELQLDDELTVIDTSMQRCNAFARARRLASCSSISESRLRRSRR